MSRDLRGVMMRSIGLVLALVVCARGAWAQETVVYYTTDAVGSVRMVTDSGGAVVARYDYRPFGDPCGTACGPQGTTEKRQFAGKEKDVETDLDYFGARFYANQTGRFSTVDPVLDVGQSLANPQRWNRYSYALNSPFIFEDPSGAAIELVGDETDRDLTLSALCAAVGTTACPYLYVNQYKGKYYVGVYTNGPSGKGLGFGDINPIAAVLGTMIGDDRVLQLGIASAGSRVTAFDGVSAVIGTMPFATPGATFTNSAGNLQTVLLDPRSGSYGLLDPSTMSDGKAGFVDSGILAIHELGHVQYAWAGILTRLIYNSNDSALYLENVLRRYRNPAGPTRILHNPPRITN